MGLAYGDVLNHLIILAGGGLIEPMRRKGKPKIFIAQGVKDTTMPPDVSGRKNAALLKKEEYDVTYREHEGGHRTPPEITREAMLWFLGKDAKPSVIRDGEAALTSGRAAADAAGSWAFAPARGRSIASSACGPSW